MSRRGFTSEVLKTVQVRGEKIDIRVNSDGQFSAHVGLDSFTTETLKELMTKLRKAAAKTRVLVAVPATLLNVKVYEGGERGFSYRKFIKVTCKRVTLTSINPKTNGINFIFDDTGKKSSDEKEDTFTGRVEFGQPMTPEQIAEWERLYVAKNEATDAFYAFEKPLKLEAFKVVKQAMGEAVDNPGEPLEDADEDPRPLVDDSPEDPV